MKYYYEFIGQKLNLPISICMNSVDNTLFHQNSEVELIYILKDSFTFSLKNKEYTLNTRDIAVIAPDVIHSIKKNVDSAVILIIHINHQNQLFVNDLIKSYKYKTAILSNRTSPTYKFVKESLKNIFEILLSDKREYCLLSLSSYKLLLILQAIPDNLELTNLRIPSEKNTYFEMVTYLNNNYRNNINLHDVANYLHFSPSYTSKYIKKYAGEPFGKYLARIRLRASLNELINTDKPIIDLALQYGFANSKAYSFYFKEFYILTPNAYRKRFKYESKINKFDEKEGVFDLTEEKYQLIKHLFVYKSEYQLSTTQKSDRIANKFLDSFIIRNLEFCIRTDNVNLLDDLNQILNIDHIIIDCIEFSVENNLKLGYGIMGILDVFARYNVPVHIIGYSEDLKILLVHMQEILKRRYNNVEIEFDNEYKTNNIKYCNNIEYFVDSFINNIQLPVYVKDSGDNLFLVDDNNFKSSYLFVFALINHMQGEILLVKEGLLVTKQGTKIKILFYYDKDSLRPEEKIFDLKIDDMEGRYLLTTYFVTDIFNDGNMENKNDPMYSISNLSRRYLKATGKFGHSTEIIECLNSYEMHYVLEQNEMKIIILDKL